MLNGPVFPLPENPRLRARCKRPLTRTEAGGFVRTVWQRAVGLMFLHGRLNFHYPDGRRASRNSGAPSVLVAYSHDDASRLQESRLDGTFVWIDK